MIFNSSYQTVDLEIEVTEEEYREWYIPRALRSFFCYSPAALGVLLVDFQLIASTYRLSAKSLSGSSYYIPSLLSISTVDAIEALNAISGGEDIPAATIGVDGTSSVRVRALAGITSASYLTVGGETTVRNVHVEAPLSSAGIDFFGSYPLQRDSSLRNALSFLLKSKTQLAFDTGAKQVYAERIGKSSIRYASCWWNTRAGQLELDERQGCNFKEARPDPRTGQKTGPTVIPRATAVREGSLSLVHQKPSSTKAARSVLVSPKRRKEGHERHREDSRTRHDSDPEGCADQFDFSLCHLEIVCPELGYGVGRECQYISSSSSKAKISINSIILPLFASEAVSSLSRSSRSSKRSLLIPILLKEEVNRSRCSFEAGVRNCPPHHPEEQWLCCFARLQRETPKVPTLNRKKEQSTICLTHAPGIPRHRERVRANLLLEGKLAKSIERACYALALLPSAKLRREKKRIVGWDEALVDIASVPGMRLGYSRAGFSIGKETGEGELAVIETIRMDDMDFFEIVNHFFHRERAEKEARPTGRGRSFRTRWLQNGGAAPEALPQAPAPT
ncbi:hypothetical protein KY289_019274 [Solanum tuberosum]|nr:hypothetical protein KY289_019274 [Solanum tuberosum]